MSVEYGKSNKLGMLQTSSPTPPPQPPKVGTAKPGPAKKQSRMEDEVLGEQGNPGSDEAGVEVHAPSSHLRVLGSVNPVRRSGSTNGPGARRSTGMPSVAPTPTTRSRYKQSTDMFDGFRSASGIPRAGPAEVEHGKLIMAILSLGWKSHSKAHIYLSAISLRHK